VIFIYLILFLYTKVEKLSRLSPQESKSGRLVIRNMHF
jgi:hypothetical protein